MKKVLFAGGGTGGHVYMGIALASELRKEDKGIEICFAGSDRGIENKIIPGLGYRLETISLGGLKNVGSLQTLRTFAQLPPALIKSLRIVHSFNPSIIVCVGGYSAGPLALAGRILRKPVLLIEPNAFPGLTNRLLSRFAQGAALAWEESSSFFPAGKKITGIPVRPEFHQIPKAESSDGRRIRLLVFGGSQGSRPINRLMVKALPFLDLNTFSIVHQTGTMDFDEVRKGYMNQGWKDAEVIEYISDMPNRFNWSDLILSRSGASTVAEVAASGRASILIPFPQAADNHQKKNALAMTRRDAAICLDQEELTGEKLADTLNRISRNRERLKDMAWRAGELAKPDSSREIVKFMRQLTQRNRSLPSSTDGKPRSAGEGEERTGSGSR